MTYEELEARLAEWAKDRPEVRAVVTVGSRARGTADRWSDLDILILTSDRTALAADPSWLDTFGEAWLTYKDEAGPGDPEWFVMYDGGLKFDAVLLDEGARVRSVDHGRVSADEADVEADMVDETGVVGEEDEVTG